MKRRSLQQVLNGAGKLARRRAFAQSLPIAISRDGQVVLVYSGGRTEEATASRLDDLVQTKS